MDWNLFNVITEQLNFCFLTPHGDAEKKTPINMDVNIFSRFPAICITGVSSSTHPAQTAVSANPEGCFPGSPGIYLCSEHGEMWGGLAVKGTLFTCN